MSSKDLPTRFSDLPKGAQKQLIDRAARIAATAYVAQTGAKATTSTALSHAAYELALHGAHQAVQQSHLPAVSKQHLVQEFAETLAGHHAGRDQLERRILNEIEAVSRPQSEQQPAESSFGNSVMEGMTFGLWSKKQ